MCFFIDAKVNRPRGSAREAGQSLRLVSCFPRADGLPLHGELAGGGSNPRSRSERTRVFLKSNEWFYERILVTYSPEHSMGHLLLARQEWGKCPPYCALFCHFCKPFSAIFIRFCAVGPTTFNRGGRGRRRRAGGSQGLTPRPDSASSPIDRACGRDTIRAL